MQEILTNGLKLGVGGAVCEAAVVAAAYDEVDVNVDIVVDVPLDVALDVAVNAMLVGRGCIL